MRYPSQSNTSRAPSLFIILIIIHTYFYHRPLPQVQVVWISKKEIFFCVFNALFNLMTSTVSRGGCQMVHFHFENPNFGGPWNSIFYNHLEYLQPFGIIYCRFYLYFMAIWYKLCPDGILRPFGTFWYFVPRKIWQPWSTGGRGNKTYVKALKMKLKK
jgi:hypothetical protein